MHEYDLQGGTGGLNSGLVDFELEVTPFWPGELPIQPQTQQPKQTLAERGMINPTNPTQLSDH